MTPHANARGFTLIELMITVAIIAILSSIAYPSYRWVFTRTNRADARTALLENAQYLERNFTEANRYHQDAAGTAVALPVTQLPRDGSGATTYQISLDGSSNATQYLLLATPVAGGPMAGDGCGTLTLNQLGQKGVRNAQLPESDCWRR